MIYLAIRSDMILMAPTSRTPYNFTKSIEQVDLSGQGQPKRINKEIFKNRIKNGFYIEAGAFDGELRSNSLFYELTYGWDGLLVEPNPSAFEELKLKVINFFHSIIDQSKDLILHSFYDLIYHIFPNISVLK